MVVVDKKWGSIRTLWETPIKTKGAYCELRATKPHTVFIQLYPYIRSTMEEKEPILYRGIVNVMAVRTYHVTDVSRELENIPIDLDFRTPYPFVLTVDKVGKVVLESYDHIKILGLYCVRSRLHFDDLQKIQKGERR
jgi:hypothetical protein